MGLSRAEKGSWSPFSRTQAAKASGPTRRLAGAAADTDIGVEQTHGSAGVRSGISTAQSSLVVRAYDLANASNGPIS